MPAAEQTANHALRTNRQRTIQLIRDRGPLSRSELADLTGLHSSTLTYITRSLLQAELIRTCGKKASSGVGKKQVLIEINPQYGWVVGVALEACRVSMSILDASGALIHEAWLGAADASPQDLIVEQLNTIAADKRLSLKRLRGVGVAAALDAEPDLSDRVGAVSEDEAAVCEALANLLHAPVVVETRSNAAALAEARRGNASLVNTFVYLMLVRDGVQANRTLINLSASLFLDGRLYRGARWAAGQIAEPLLKRMRLILTREDLAALGQPGAALTRDARLFDERLRDTLHVLAELLDPQVIVIGGDFPIANASWAASLERALNQVIHPQRQQPLPIRITAFPEQGPAFGAALAAIDVALFRGQATGAIPFTP